VTGVPEATPTDSPECDFREFLQAPRRRSYGAGSDQIYCPSRGPSRPHPPAQLVVVSQNSPFEEFANLIILLYADGQQLLIAPLDLGAEALSPPSAPQEPGTRLGVPRMSNSLPL
jgi:hypothetical protein